MIKVTVKSSDFETFNKKDGSGQFSMQTVWAHTFNRSGKKDYPEELRMFVSKNDRGVPQPYAPGEYKLDPSSLVIEKGSIRVNFPVLVPLMQVADKQKVS